MMHQCIHCGKELDCDKPCACPDCGYRMFPAPYDRSQVLRSEMQRYLRTLISPTLTGGDVCYARTVPPKKTGGKEKRVLKTEDANRFPSFEKLQGYVCNATKTEAFHERLTQSIEELRKHLSTPYAQEYEADLAAYQTRVAGYARDLAPALKILGLKTEEVPSYIAPKASLAYSETPDDGLLSLAGQITDRLAQLSDKIFKFIRQNNMYGTAFQYRPKIVEKRRQAKADGWPAVLAKYEEALDTVLEKRYMPDIFSDGADELGEMLDPLWNAIALLMECPVLKRTNCYTVLGEADVDWERFAQLVEEHCASRASDLLSAFSDPAFLADVSEQRLLELYDELIAADSHGILGVSKSSLLQKGKSEAKLALLIGLQSIKDSILKIKAYALANKGSGALNLHMCFYGNPGTGKTEVARLIAGILHENKILPTDHFVEVDRSGLVGQYVGETPQKTMQVIQKAMGGVLFIDEAYALIPKDGGNWDYGHEAIATLLKAMEDHRGEFCVILAGYKNEMEKMLASNPGFVSRIQFTLDFPNYSRGELGEILELMLKERKYTMAENAKEKALDVIDIKRKEPNFANARELRNVLDQVVMCQAVRTLDAGNREIGLVDVEKYIADSKLHLPLGNGARKVLTGEEELERLVGLQSVKRMVRKIKAYATHNQGDDQFNLHMCFYGNPGTGKTEVARILSRILYDAKVLPEAKVVETNALGLLGKVVGETAPKTLDKINEADGGVLFIDEAYAMLPSPGGAASYGAEALAVLLKEMEDRRGRFCVIFAGYEREMTEMLSANPGLESRIQFKLDFQDYTRDDLAEIAQLFLGKKGYSIDPDALERVLDVADHFRKRPNFANARTIRNILDQVLLNQNLRAEDTVDDRRVICLQRVPGRSKSDYPGLRDQGRRRRLRGVPSAEDCYDPRRRYAARVGLRYALPSPCHIYHPRPCGEPGRIPRQGARHPLRGGIRK